MSAVIRTNLLAVIVAVATGTGAMCWCGLGAANGREAGADQGLPSCHRTEGGCGQRGTAPANAPACPSDGRSGHSCPGCNRAQLTAEQTVVKLPDAGLDWRPLVQPWVQAPPAAFVTSASPRDAHAMARWVFHGESLRALSCLLTT